MDGGRSGATSAADAGVDGIGPSRPARRHYRRSKSREFDRTSTPRAGLEPATLRLTAGCSAN
jgi:hypothetical protein